MKRILIGLGYAVIAAGGAFFPLLWPNVRLTDAEVATLRQSPFIAGLPAAPPAATALGPHSGSGEVSLADLYDELRRWTLR